MPTKIVKLMGEVSEGLKILERHYKKKFIFDAYGYRPLAPPLFSILERALKSGLDDNKSTYLSCCDLATTIDPLVYADEQRVLGGVWNERRNVALSLRTEQRRLRMNLHPKYFAAIRCGRKTYEGRAYDPKSVKAYEDIFPGDEIRFALDPESPDFENELAQNGLVSSEEMFCIVQDVYFTPTVHGMFRCFPELGEAFQPMINWHLDLYQLQSAAVYYSFPGYPERIADFGFVGIGLSVVQN